jgi:diguanylate cyclase (GGDEF)-like protein
VVLLVSFVSLSLFNYNTAQRSVRDQIATSSLPLLRENIYSDIREDLMPAVNVSSMMAHDSFLIDWMLDGERDVGAVTRYLAKIRSEYGYVSTFLVSSLTSFYYHFDGVLKSISPTDPHDVWFYQFVESGKTFELDVDTDEAAENRLTIFVNNRLEDLDGELLGVTGVGIEMAGFSRYLDETQTKYDRHIYLVDRAGRVMAHSDVRLVENENLYERKGIRDVAGELLNPRNTPTTAEYRQRGGDVLVSARFMPEIDWFLVVEQDISQSLQAARRNLVRTLIIGLIASSLVIAVTAYAMDRFNRRIEELATIDSLTGAANRRELDRQLSRLVSRSRRHGAPVSMVIFDIDHFKEINDTLGHHVGDKVLVAVAEVSRATLRPEDLLVRWGGDEFIVLIEGDIRDARALADRLQAQCRESDAVREPAPMFRVTVSLGVAEYQTGESEQSFLQRSDRALYRAKQNGRDRIVEAAGSGV